MEKVQAVRIRKRRQKSCAFALPEAANTGAADAAACVPAWTPAQRAIDTQKTPRFGVFFMVLDAKYGRGLPLTIQNTVAIMFSENTTLFA